VKYLKSGSFCRVLPNEAFQEILRSGDEKLLQKYFPKKAEELNKEEE